MPSCAIVAHRCYALPGDGLLIDRGWRLYAATIRVSSAKSVLEPATVMTGERPWLSCAATLALLFTSHARWLSILLYIVSSLSSRRITLVHSVFVCPK